jgi:uncharacterized integral membrane protein (TIGR00701 family)
VTFLILRALHIISIVCWFAGLFYLVRLFIYHVEAFDDAEPKRSILTAQFALMARRLWYAITVPAMCLTAATGTWLMLGYHDLLHEPWLQVKLVFLALLFGTTAGASANASPWVSARTPHASCASTTKSRRFCSSVSSLSPSVATAAWPSKLSLAARS